MEFDLSSTQKMMQQAARTFLTKECPTKRVRELMATDHAFDPRLWSAMAEQGWLGVAIDEGQGGLGLSALELAVIAEEMGRACLPGPFITHVWASSLIAAAPHALSAKWLPQICAGERRAAVALLEKDPSWSPAAVQMQVARDGGQLRLDGVKRLVSDAATSDLLLCVARDESGLAVLCVDVKAPGVSIRPTPGIDETRKLYEVRFAGVKLSADAVLCRGADAEQALTRATQLATVAVCAELVGLMAWALETSVEYVKTRQQFGRTVGSFQAVQQLCVDSLLLLESARSATYFAAWAVANSDPGAAAAVSAAKAYASDAAREALNRAIQSHGGIGFTWEHDLHLYYKRAKSNEILFGDAAFHREEVARLAIDPQRQSLASAS